MICIMEIKSSKILDLISSIANALYYEPVKSGLYEFYYQPGRLDYVGVGWTGLLNKGNPCLDTQLRIPD